MTGAFSWAGAMVGDRSALRTSHVDSYKFTGASVALVAGQGIVGLIILKKPDIVYQRWMGFVGFQIINALSGTYHISTFARADRNSFPAELSRPISSTDKQCKSVFISWIHGGHHHYCTRSESHEAIGAICFH